MRLDCRHGISYWRSLLSYLPFALLFGYHPDMDSAKVRVGSFGYFFSFSRDRFLLLSGYDIQPNLDETQHHMGCLQLDWIVAIDCGINETLKQRSGKEVHRRLFSLVKLATLVAVNLSIIGATKSSNGVHAGPTNSLSKVGVVIILVAWAGLVFLLFLIGMRYRQIENREHRLVLLWDCQLLFYSFAMSTRSWRLSRMKSKFNMITTQIPLFCWSWRRTLLSLGFA
ncbi:uncharacterized protein N7446_000931 [Penicillium canescens]|uniref:DUF7702 domain-containing protein n=1 Tax=Penicillium canescens TaxID=5083 RepID=A0AAD6I3L1_PENCN|nr:uncharacterized protein N7446_000931 [Penicillium canescens]KAJ6030007.1 hypothetical protein N7460_010273 [Penicillium canescens]KAJ6060384.1 hypothetical protein N7444_002238 [Penicillium canescens]KAJ6077995.1 hypothetical protein N7446_000931 [Penicillium canescens]